MAAISGRLLILMSMTQGRIWWEHVYLPLFTSGTLGLLGAILFIDRSPEHHSAFHRSRVQTQHVYHVQCPS